MKFTTFTTSTAKQKYLYTEVEYFDKQVFLFFGKYNGNKQPYREWLNDRIQEVNKVLSKYTGDIGWVGEVNKKNSDIYKNSISDTKVRKLDEIAKLENGMICVGRKWVNTETLSISDLYYISVSTNKEFNDYKYNVHFTLEKVMQNNHAIKACVELANSLNSKWPKSDKYEEYEAVVIASDEKHENGRLTTLSSTKDGTMLHYKGRPLHLKAGNVVRFKAKHLLFRVSNTLTAYSQIDILRPSLEVIPKEASIHLSLK